MIVLTHRRGSGKTVSCNHIIEYLAARGMAVHALGDKLAQASAVLEAFGNAPTIHNANSSRYAKVVNVGVLWLDSGADDSRSTLTRPTSLSERPSPLSCSNVDV